MQDRVKDPDTDKTDDAATAAEILTTAKGLGALLGQVPALQQALLRGADNSAKRETERLAKRYGERDARVQAARDRAEGIAALRTESQAAADYGANAARTLTSQNLFHGYVRDAKGAPAKGHLARMRILDERYAKQRLTAETDAAGYFCMDLPFGKPQDTGEETGPEGRIRTDWRFEDVLAARFASLAAGSKADEADPSKVFESSEQERYKTEVQILDPAGKVVLVDEEPPELAPPLSVFRHYVLGGVGKRRTACRGEGADSGSGGDPS